MVARTKVPIAEQIARQAACRGCVLRGWDQINYYFGVTDKRQCKRILKHYKLTELEPGSGRPMLSVDAFVKLVTEHQVLASRQVKATAAATMAQRQRTTLAQKGGVAAARTDLPKLPGEG